MSPVWTIFGSVSMAAELNMLRVSSARWSTTRYRTAPWSCTIGLPVYVPIASLPYSSRMAINREATSSYASSQEISSQPVAVRRTGRRSRSGSWYSSFTPYAFGQM
jgi:hypothetical protein